MVIVISQRNINGINFKKEVAYITIIKTATTPFVFRMPLIHSNISEGIQLASFGKSKYTEFLGAIKATNTHPVIIVHPAAKKPFNKSRKITGSANKIYSVVNRKNGFLNCCLINCKSFLEL